MKAITKVKWNDKEVNKILGLSMVDRMATVCLKIEADVKSSFRGSPPSSPGSPPAVRTGHLRRSITSDWTDKKIPSTGVKAPTSKYPVISGVIGSNLAYARIHELGGQTGRNHSVKLPARPYLRPALERAKPAVKRIFEKL